MVQEAIATHLQLENDLARRAGGRVTSAGDEERKASGRETQVRDTRETRDVWIRSRMDLCAVG